MSNQSVQISQSTSNEPLLISFLNKFVNQSFIEDIINTTVYQADVDTFTQKHEQISTLDQINTFLADIYKDIERLKRINSLGNYPVNLVKLNINVAKKVIELKQNISSRLITYDTLDEHFSKSEVHINTLLNRVKQKRLKNIDEFKNKLSEILDKIRLGNEIRNIKESLNELDQLKVKLSANDCNLLDVVVSYRNAVNNAAAQVTKIRSINITESLSNSIMIGGPGYDPNQIVDNTMKYLSSGYAMYKSGYKIFDENIGGIEAANLHLICGPSNNAKSIFMINLLRLMALNNKNEFKPNDLMLYITLEDK